MNPKKWENQIGRHLINSFNNYIYNLNIVINWKIIIAVTSQTDGMIMKENDRMHGTEVVSYREIEAHISIAVVLNVISMCI